MALSDNHKRSLKTDIVVGLVSLGIMALVGLSLTREDGFLTPHKKVAGNVKSDKPGPPKKQDGIPLSDPSQPLNVTTANDFFQRAHKKQEVEDFKGAIEDFKEACRLDPIRKFYWSGLGDAYRLDNQLELSRDAFLRVYSLDVFDTNNLTSLGFVAQLLRNDAEARRYYLMALSIQPDLGDAWGELYNVVRGLGMESWYETVKSLSLAPNAENNNDVVYQLNEQVLAENPKDYYSLVNRAFMNIRFLRLNNVQADVDRALSIDKNGPAALIAQAQLYASQAKVDKAIAAYKACIAVSPQPVAYAELGELEGQIGNLDEAVHDYGLATEYGNDKPSWISTFNLLKVQKQQRDQANAALKAKNIDDKALAASKSSGSSGFSGSTASDAK